MNPSILRNRRILGVLGNVLDNFQLRALVAFIAAQLFAVAHRRHVLYDHERDVLFFLLVILDDFDFGILVEFDVLDFQLLLNLFLVVDDLNHRCLLRGRRGWWWLDNVHRNLFIFEKIGFEVDGSRDGHIV